MLTKKDIISLNGRFSNGNMLNESSLDFVLAQTRHSPHWYKTMCLLSRALLVDHVFEDGNKRTAAALIMTYLDMNQRDYNPDHIGRVVLRVARQNIKDIQKIGRLIHHATK